MSRYYFHIPEPNSDPEGTELPDLAAARREALLAAREILANAIKTGSGGRAAAHPDYRRIGAGA